MKAPETFPFLSIGSIQSCFKEKFGIPRQSGLSPSATAILKLHDDDKLAMGLKHIESFSHLWIFYIFHQHINIGWTPIIHPPRVDGPQKVGVFASRSPHRPNPLGLSVVKLERVDFEAKGGAEIHISGIDILDGSPVVDIKPYLPYADRIADANSGWAENEIPRYPVEFSELSLKKIKEKTPHTHPKLQTLIKEMVEIDPRPTSQKKAMPFLDPDSEGREFAFRLFDFDLRWQIQNGSIWVRDLIVPGSEPLTNKKGAPKPEPT